VGPKESLHTSAKTPALVEYMVRRQIDNRVFSELGPLPEEDDEDAMPAHVELRDRIREEISAAFEEWLTVTWSPWAERNRPVFAARDLYARLYELHLRAEADSATHEVVWGHVILSARDAGKSIVSPMLTVRATLQIDSEDATIRVVPENVLELELNAIEGTDLPGLDALASLQSTLRMAPPDAWAADERLAVRRQIIAPLGLDAVLNDSADPAVPKDAVQVNDGWVLFLRKRPLRQERFYDELAHKIRDERFLPEGLASVVADRDRVDQAVRAAGGSVSVDDGTADRLLMPLPANAEQARIARQLATSRGVTVQGPPGTGKSHTIVNLISHLVAQGKRVLVTAEKEQALAVLRDKIPSELRDLSIAVLGSTPAAMENLRGAAQSMQDSLSSIDVDAEERRCFELGLKVDQLREAIQRTDAALVEALRSEQREYQLPSGSARAPQVSEWLATQREVDVIEDQVPLDAVFPVTAEELAELAEILRSTSVEDAGAALLALPEAEWLPTAADLKSRFARLEGLRSKVTSLEDRGLRIEAIDGLSLDAIRRNADWFRESAARLRGLSGQWEDAFSAAIRKGDSGASWTLQHNAKTRERLAFCRDLASQLAGHTVIVPDGNPQTQISMLQAWAGRVAAGKKLSLFASKELKEFAAQVRVDGFPVTTTAQLDLVRTQIELRAGTREAHVLMAQAYAPSEISVPPIGDGFLFVADELAARVDAISQWWVETYPELATQVGSFVAIEDVLTPESLDGAAVLLDGAAARLEERQLTSDIAVLKDQIAAHGSVAQASPLWGLLVSALELSRPDQWQSATDETRRLVAIRARVLRANALEERLAKAGAPAWARAIKDSRGTRAVVGDVINASLAWDRARARTWLLSLHAATDIEPLMARSHDDAAELRRVIVDLASRSARVALKKNMKDRQRRALETWLTAVKRVGKGTGKNAPRFQAAAREALPAAMGAVPIWIMPIYRVMENFDPRVSDLFDVVIVDESSQCDLLSLGVMALGKKTVVVGDDKQTTPERVGVPTDRIAALQDQHLRGMPEAKLLTLDDSLYSISGRAFPSTIALKEHFRCVPEIIEFSNRYYNGAILPLREVSVPQIGEPLKVVRVDNAISSVVGSSRVNLEEARAIAAQVAECAHDTSYDGLTFGVVTMMSGPQSQIIQDMIREEIGDEEFENRRLRVGNPPLFQGDERNVMFVSMVAHDASFAATTARYAQWANVAASRAQDQLWIFHSMDPATLHHEDHRRAMIEYAGGHSRGEEVRSLYEMTESAFERDVLKQMLQRGYEVEPQYRVGSYRIDFVVRVAPGERLAVECDGDSFHGPDKWDDDVRRQRVLERLGWTFWRIRASKYYLDPEEAMTPLWARLDEMKARAEAAQEVVRLRQQAAEQRQLEKLREERFQEDVAKAEAGDEEREASARRANAPTLEMELAAEHPTAPGGVALSPHLALDGRAADPALVREWARQEGYSVGDRGRISREIAEAYISLHSRDARPSISGREMGERESSRASRAVAETPPHEAPQFSRDSSRSNAALAWKFGTPYQLDSEGNIRPQLGGPTLDAEIGSAGADQLRDIMRALRPGGGRFKVDREGNMFTLVEGEPTYVCTVPRDGWFMAHWNVR